jgi:ketosteroid isomerase-like protein
MNFMQYNIFVMTLKPNADFHEGDATIDVFGDTAIATYRFEIAYEMNGKTFSESGRDVFIFVRAEEGWQAVWRTVVHMA